MTKAHITTTTDDLRRQELAAMKVVADTTAAQAAKLRAIHTDPKLNAIEAYDRGINEWLGALLLIQFQQVSDEALYAVLSWHTPTVATALAQDELVWRRELCTP